jgi:hypothetical protein
MGIRYESDFYGWTQEQANLLRSDRLGEIDFENLIEEVESMGRSEKRALESAIGRLLQHLLKWKFQPTFRCRSWELSIGNHRDEAQEEIDENPSLKPKLEEIYPKAYKKAMAWAELETGIDRKAFPDECPWTFGQAMTPGFFPE